VVCSRKPWFRLGNWLLVAEAERRARVEQRRRGVDERRDEHGHGHGYRH
jgi:hypothetical protein